ncbi:Very-long-chain (3R)-3-hydroxyacyl-CoA dehydratase [Rhynchospora pubera]|uniref:Very-long-chain (3R)-3-hydroxyacyl-CoA dehydratase n=1 Tax=Rhynchospora pubera TaxID=906938 RepID=A0AAV8EL90_9POAL|nr:Very-long-chain (3R)-3-hydroxyacyl-CoA dehydratase [Rhynchospora pubera]
MASFFSTVKRIYLAIYNWAVFTGWIQVLIFAIKALNESGPAAVYDAVEKPLQLAQTAAILEIIHGLIGLVRSPVSATLPQIGSRLFVTWGILHSFPETRTHILVSSLVISWSLTEIIRYSFFGMKEALGFTPSWLLWLRYSTFLLLYPTGITSEVGLIYIALPYIKVTDNPIIKEFVFLFIFYPLWNSYQLCTNNLFCKSSSSPSFLAIQMHNFPLLI